MDKEGLLVYIKNLLGEIPKKDIIAENIIDQLKNIPASEQIDSILTMVEIAKLKNKNTVNWGVDKDKLIKGLQNARHNICCYASDPCDCKFGVEKIENKYISKYIGENTGCPEIRQAEYLVRLMTDEEFVKISNREPTTDE